MDQPDMIIQIIYFNIQNKLGIFIICVLIENKYKFYRFWENIFSILKISF